MKSCPSESLPLPSALKRDVKACNFSSYLSRDVGYAKNHSVKHHVTSHCQLFYLHPGMHTRLSFFFIEQLYLVAWFTCHTLCMDLSRNLTDTAQMIRIYYLAQSISKLSPITFKKLHVQLPLDVSIWRCNHFAKKRMNYLNRNDKLFFRYNLYHFLFWI